MNDTAAATPPGVDRDNPWPGLVAFTEQIGDFFYGRRAEQDELLRTVLRGTGTLLFGRSGLGKTSLLQAGLVPRLRLQGFVPILIRLDLSVAGQPLLAQVKAALLRTFETEHLTGLPPFGADETVWEYLHRADVAPRRPDGTPAMPFLAFDQFEEVFTLGLPRPERNADCQAFLAELACLVENRPPPAFIAKVDADPDLAERYNVATPGCKILIALREDYLAAIEPLRRQAPSLRVNAFRLTAMTGEQAMTAIVEPGGGLVDAAVAEQIVRFIGRPRADLVAADPSFAGSVAALEVEPSLLSLFCRELNDRRRARGLATITPELVSGSRETIPADFYERALAGQPDAVRRFIEDELVTERGQRESVSRDRAEQLLRRDGVDPAALDELVNRRLLRTEEHLDVPRIELIHDVLIDVVMRSRAARRAATEADKREAALRAELSRARRRWMIGAGAVLAAVIVAAVALGFWTLTKKNAELAEKSEQVTRLYQALQATNDQVTALKNKLQSSLQTFATDLNKLDPTTSEDDQLLLMLQSFDRLGDDLEELDGKDSEAIRSAESGIAISKLDQDKSNSPQLRQFTEIAMRIADKLARRGGTNGLGLKGAGFLYAFAATTTDHLGNLEAALPITQKSADAFARLSRDDYWKADYWQALSMQQHAELVHEQYKRDNKSDQFDTSIKEINGAIAFLEKSRYAKEVDYLLGDAAIRREMAGWYSDKGGPALPLAVQAYRGAFDKNVAAFRAGDSIDTRQALLKQIRSLADAESDDSEIEASRKSHEQAIDAAVSLIPNDEKLAAEHHYDTAEARRTLVEVLIDFGDFERDSGSPDKAPDLYRRAIATLNEQKVQKTDDTYDLARCEYRIADWLADRNRGAEAIPYYDAAERDFKAVLHDRQLNQSFALLSYTERRSASLLIAMSRAQEAEKHVQITVMQAQIIDAYENTPDSRKALVNALGSATWVDDLRRDWLQAKQEAIEALTVAARPPVLRIDTDWIRVNEAHAVLMLGDLAGAEQLYTAVKDKAWGEKKTYADSIREDYAQFRKLGIDTPQMRQVETDLHL